MSGQPRLHVLGCGRAAVAVARRLIDTGRARPGLIVNRSVESARRAAAFIGGGEAAAQLDARIAGDWLMLGLPDGVLVDSLEDLVGDLAAPPGLVFHLSGSVEAAVLRIAGAPVAAVHPVRAFSDPEHAAAHFAGTWCVAEGDDAALEVLRPVFEAAGGRWLAFAARDKAAWHAATVAASNFLVTTQALARELADQAGLPEAQAAEVLCDLQLGTLEGLRERSPREVLTGPIERGDEAACRRLLTAAAGLNERQLRLFSELGLATLDLAQVKRGERAGDRALAALFAPTSD
ncbi:DUF2520 domain-containing protein [Wenzhouxiangella sp. EGI_FJ10409]|uniref:DUF2520 domain-containing protein n=1 Tax=Wenzhouxiangella sp. EGI_FJ10409 TaxID=3243767 RepID=UPI0035DDD2CD